MRGAPAKKPDSKLFSPAAAARLPVQEAYAASTERVLGRAVQEALAGFDELAAAGFWLNRQQALRLIRYLFRLRGVGHLLPLLARGMAKVAGETPQVVL